MTKAKKRRQAGHETSYLYAIGLPGGPIKIGYSRNPDTRIFGISKKAGQKCHIAAEAPVPLELALAAEKYAHWLLRAHHYRHEWFDITDEQAREALRTATDPALLEPFAGVLGLLPCSTREPHPMWGGLTLKVRFPPETIKRLIAANGTAHNQDFIRAAVEEKLQALSNELRRDTPLD